MIEPHSTPIRVLNTSQCSNQFFGNVVEICVVTRNHQQTMSGFVQLGIGPWRVYTFNAETVTDQTYRRQPAEYAIKVCFAQSKNVIWEIMQPLSGPTILQDF